MSGTHLFCWRTTERSMCFAMPTLMKMTARICMKWISFFIIFQEGGNKTGVNRTELGESFRRIWLCCFFGCAPLRTKLHRVSKA